jgi:hypothetical protein
MRISENRYERDIRKHSLAKWMIAHLARTKTLTQWTGLTRYRVQTLFRNYLKTNQGTRRRGVSPFQPAYFGRSLRLESESLALAFFAAELDVLPDSILPNARRALPDVARGERLMMAYELYRAAVPDARISLEHAILLLVELAERRNLYLRRCRTCNDVMVVERYGGRHAQCPFCRQDRRVAAGEDERRGASTN